MNEPTTPTGRRLFTDNEPMDMMESDGVLWEDIVAIEAEARADALDVEALVRALNDVALRDRTIDSFDAVPVRVLATAIHRAILAERQP